MTYFRITLHRSVIGLPRRTRDTLAALGLHRRSQTVFQRVGPDSAGKIMKVKELVRVEEVDCALSKWELREERRPDPGFYIESRGVIGSRLPGRIVGGGKRTKEV